MNQHDTLFYLKENFNINKNVFNLAKDFLNLLILENVIPDRISELEVDDTGIGYAFYFKKDQYYEIYFEFYTDLEFGFIVIDKNYQIVKNEDINDFKIFIDFMKE
jgi:hypothetical protein